MSDATKVDASAGIEAALQAIEHEPATPPGATMPTSVPESPVPSTSPELATGAPEGTATAEAPASDAAAATTTTKRLHAPIALAPVAESEAQNEIKKLRNDVLEARQALRQREAELEVSQQMGRETLAKLKDQHERTLRAIADLENHKKRVVKEREDTARFGQEKLLRDFLPVLDNFERALEHAKAAADFEGLKSGLVMTRKLFEDTLSRHGVKGFSALNQPFDPKLHEAIQTVESDAPANTVVMEIVRGFTLHDRLMRPAMVAVAKPRPVEGAKETSKAAAAAPSPEAEASSAQPSEKPQS